MSICYRHIMTTSSFIRLLYYVYTINTIACKFKPESNTPIILYINILHTRPRESNNFK